jgi:hypothetical protein
MSARTQASDETYIGTDGDGAVHSYSKIGDYVRVHEADGDVDVIDLEGTPIDEPGQWRDHVTTKRGPWKDCRVGLEPLHEEISAVLEVLE